MINSDPMQSRVINFIHEGIDVKTPEKQKKKKSLAAFSMPTPPNGGAKTTVV